MTDEMLFHIRRHQILESALHKDDDDWLVPAHVAYGWQNGIYPDASGEDIAKPFAKFFPVSKAMMNQLQEHLADLNILNETITYSELKEKFVIEREWGSQAQFDQALRYLSLIDGRFEFFWQNFAIGDPQECDLYTRFRREPRSRWISLTNFDR